ncbi:MAG: FtsX-like permease family protein, partial [Clostridium sp.]
MYFKMALENIKRSFKEYWIYFITLTIGVCLFYSFNTIDGQIVAYNIEFLEFGTPERVYSIINAASIIILIATALMVIYSNVYILRRRKKELTTYMSLGMSRHDVNKILIYETIIVGIASLIVGLFIGMIFSQVVGILIVKGLGISVESSAFILSKRSLLKVTLGYGIIYFVTALYNAYVVGELLSKETRGNLVGKCRKISRFSGVVLTLSIVGILLAYKLALDVGFMFSEELIIAIILGIVCTILIFAGLAATIKDKLNNSNNTGFKGIGIFTISQLNLRLVGNSIVIGVICLLMFVSTMCIVFGISYKVNVDKQFNVAYPYDASLEISDYKGYANDIDQFMTKRGYKPVKGEKRLAFNLYQEKLLEDTRSATLVLEGSMKATYKVEPSIMYIKLTDFNIIRKFHGIKPIELDNNQVYVYTNNIDYLRVAKDYINQGRKLNILDRKFTPVSDNMPAINNSNDYFVGNKLYFVVNDSYMKDLREVSTMVNFNYPDKISNNTIKNLYGWPLTQSESIEDSFSTTVVVKQVAYNALNERTSVFLYVTMFVGIMLMLSSMALLAIQQLVGIYDGIDGYRSLKKLGVSNKQINNSILVQTVVYFILPITLAISHTVVGISMLKQYYMLYNDAFSIGIMVNISVLLLGIYGLYFIATYIGCKKIIKSN